MPLNLMDQDARIHRLDQKLRNLKTLAICGILLGVVVALSGFRNKVDEVVRAERFELVSGDGLRHAIISSDTLGFLVTLVDKQGGPAGALRLSMEPRLSIETARGRELAGLGAPKVHELAE